MLRNKIGGGLFQFAEGLSTGVPSGIMDIAERCVGYLRTVGQGLLFEAHGGGSDSFNGSGDMAHGSDHNRIKMRPSMVPSQKSHKATIAEFCADTQNRLMQAEIQRKNIRVFMQSRGLKIQPWAKSAGIAEGTLRNFLKERTHSMTHDSLDRLARAANSTVAEMIGERVREPRPGKDVVAVKSLEVRASMGGGFDVVEEPEGPPFFFRRAWIEKLLDGKPGHLRIITDLDGGSMTPTINNGDIGLVLMPGEDARFQSGAVYALWDGMGLLVKRLESTVGDKPRLRVISDNPIYAPYEVDADEVKIIGRLVWRGGGI